MWFELDWVFLIVFFIKINMKNRYYKDCFYFVIEVISCYEIKFLI